MGKPGEERRLTLMEVSLAYDGMDEPWQKTYFIHSPTVAIKIDGVATVRLMGKVKGVEAPILPDISKSTIVKVDMVIEEMKTIITSWSSGNVGVYLIG